MNWHKWIYVAWACAGVLLLVGRIGKPGRPLTPAVASVSLVITGALVWLVVTA